MDGTTEAGEALAVLAALDAAGCRAWVAGGWGVDALGGRQTRPHRDLDLAVETERLGTVLEALAARGYVVETDWLPNRVELHRPGGAGSGGAGSGGGRVDVHPLTFGPDGDAVQAGLDGAVFRYPPDGFVAGVIGGVRVDCLSRELQVASHTGYELRDVDRHDLAVLASLAAGEVSP
jgi:lincosamide nucleotidyltransferase A/C/D/E